ncbi:hypothetical protein VHEMI01307 [[Torrubiella] hemipterigena]|uniref:Peptidase A1 domain-containing protein n=1 Tax=[Torrubiella] hemipterigena TaxID=1531966 RepID=A0A0A1SLM0_9HYPO|nr:hypothetical protein VHEMI01307 [[Torrubiella] hemipterigena]
MVAASPLNVNAGSFNLEVKRAEGDIYVEASIGTPAQKVNLLLVTGSADLWVITNITTGQTFDKKTPKYIPANSKLAVVVQKGTWSMSYVDDTSAEGAIYTDTVTIGGVTVKSQGVQVATKVSAGNLAVPVSGQIGFAFDYNNDATPKQTTWMTNAMSQLKESVMTADLKYDSTGTYGFGSIDKTKYTGSINYADVNKQKGAAWSWTSSGYSVGSGKFVSYSMNAFVDTGYTTFGLPYKAFQDYLLSANTTAAKVNCTTVLPDLFIGVGQGTVKIPGNHLRATNKDKTCSFNLISTGDHAVFGITFLSAVFAVFDRSANNANPRIGFANTNK